MKFVYVTPGASTDHHGEPDGWLEYAFLTRDGVMAMNQSEHELEVEAAHQYIRDLGKNIPYYRNTPGACDPGFVEKLEQQRADKQAWLLTANPMERPLYQWLLTAKVGYVYGHREVETGTTAYILFCAF